jgi:hypothetical protein
MSLGPDAIHPARTALAVTPSDSADLTLIARALYVGGAGNLSVDTVGGDTVSFVGVQAGSFLPVRVRRVRATGTTATNIVALA